MAGISGHRNCLALAAACQPAGRTASVAGYRGGGPMKLFDMIRNGMRTEQRAADPSWNALANGGAMSASGQPVDSSTAERIAAVYAFVAALSESKSTLPMHVSMRTEDGNHQRGNDHALAPVRSEERRVR